MTPRNLWHAECRAANDCGWQCSLPLGHTEHGMAHQSEPWWSDHTELARLFRWMREFTEDADFVYAAEKPWKFSPEWERALFGLGPEADDRESQPGDDP